MKKSANHITFVSIWQAWVALFLPFLFLQACASKRADQPPEPYFMKPLSEKHPWPLRKDDEGWTALSDNIVDISLVSRIYGLAWGMSAEEVMGSEFLGNYEPQSVEQLLSVPDGHFLARWRDSIQSGIHLGSAWRKGFREYYVFCSGGRESCFVLEHENDELAGVFHQFSTGVEYSLRPSEWYDHARPHERLAVRNLLAAHYFHNWRSIEMPEFYTSRLFGLHWGESIEEVADSLLLQGFSGQKFFNFLRVIDMQPGFLTKHLEWKDGWFVTLQESLEDMRSQKDIFLASWRPGAAALRELLKGARRRSDNSVEVGTRTYYSFLLDSSEGKEEAEEVNVLLEFDYEKLTRVWELTIEESSFSGILLLPPEIKVEQSEAAFVWLGHLAKTARVPSWLVGASAFFLALLVLWAVRRRRKRYLRFEKQRRGRKMGLDV